MLLHLTVEGAPVSVSLTSRALTVARDEFIAAWDPGGRLYSVVDGDRTHRRGLDGRVLTKWRENGERRRELAGRSEADAIVDRAAALARLLAGDVGAAADDVRTALARAAAFDSRVAAADARRFGEVYQPIGILPPDQYLALVLQATEGCSFRSCTFCDFYRQEYRVRNQAQFAEHVARVREFLGDSMRLRDRTVFLGSANALAVPMSGLAPLVDIVAAQFAGMPIHAFLDGFTGGLKTERDYRDLAARGLRRVYVGLESGHDPLLRFVGKPSTRQQAVETVRTIKAAGVNVGVIAMPGLGGDRFAGAHVADTAAALNDMRLGADDLIYFSDLVDAPGSPYGRSAREAGIRPLTAAEGKAQRQAIEAALSFPSSRPKIATYDVREFVY